MYAYIEAYYLCLLLSEMKTAMYKRCEEKNRLFCYDKVHYLWNGTVLFESEFGLVTNVYCKIMGNFFLENVKKEITDMQRKRKADHIKWSIKSTKGRKRQKLVFFLCGT